MPGQRSINTALDLVRMPGLARSTKMLPLPADVLDLIKIAAASPEACREATAITGEPDLVVVEAARFYLQKMLFRPEADCFRVLGVQPGVSRTVARDHMRWLIEWLHPDRNGTWDSVYAERVLKAWREFSSGKASTEPSTSGGAGGVHHHPSHRRDRGSQRSAAIRLPWIQQPLPIFSEHQKRSRIFAAFGLGVVITLVVVVLLSIAGAVFDTDSVSTSTAEPLLPADQLEASPAARSTGDKR